MSYGPDRCIVIVFEPDSSNSAKAAPDINTKTLAAASRWRTILFLPMEFTVYQLPARACSSGSSLDCGFAGSCGRRGAVEVLRAVFEGGDHAAHRLVEQELDDALQDPRLEFEIDKEIEPAAAGHPVEDPVVVEVAKRAL